MVDIALVFKLLLTVSVVLLLGGVAAYLVATRGRHPARLAIAVLLAAVALRELGALARLEPAYPFEDLRGSLWYNVWVAGGFWVTLAAVNALHAIPNRPGPRSWLHGPYLLAAALFAGGAVLWLVSPDLLLPGWAAGTATRADRGTFLYNLTLRWYGPYLALVLLLGLTLWRTRGGAVRERRTAYTLLPMLLAFLFVNSGSVLMQVVLELMGQSTSLGATAAAWGPGWEGRFYGGAFVAYMSLPVVYALLLSVRERAHAASLLLVFGIVFATLPASTGISVFAINHVWAALGPLVVIARHDGLGGADTSDRTWRWMTHGALAAAFVVTALILLTSNAEPGFVGAALALSAVLAAVAAFALDIVHVPVRTSDGTGLDGQRFDPFVVYLALAETGARRGLPWDQVVRELDPLEERLGLTPRDHALFVAAARRAVRDGIENEFLTPGALVFDRFRLVRPLSDNGNALVHLAEDVELSRAVVVKAVQTPRGREDQVLREARALANVAHPNVVTVHDVRRLGGMVLLVIEYVEGGSLAERVERDGPLAPAELDRLVDDTLGALAAVHEAGVVHRDVKPSNLLLTPDGEAKLADFGIARMPGTETTIGGVGGPGSTAAGTIRYMSPEQAQGKRVTERSDLYSAAATFIEAATGRPYLEPRPGESPIELQMRAARGRRLDGAIEGPAGLVAWFARALEPDPDERFASARDMLEAYPGAGGIVTPARTPGASGPRR